MLWGGMSGGQGQQGGKAPRRFFAPLVAVGFGASIKWRWKYLFFLLWIVIFSIGYGPNSVLHVLQIEWLMRLAYALMVSLPFLVFGYLRWVISAVLLVIAFAIRAGSLGDIAGFGQVLIEDLWRYGTWGLLVILNVLFDRD
jgi:hypothetical protein